MGDDDIGSIFGHGLSFIEGRGITRCRDASQGQKEPSSTAAPQGRSLWQMPGCTSNL